MESPPLDLTVSPKRPSEFSEESREALAYLSGVVQLAYEDVQRAVRQLQPSRGQNWYVRSQLRPLCHPQQSPEIAHLLSAHGIAIQEKQRDLFWLTVKGCDHGIRLVTRPKNSAAPPETGLYRQETLDVDGQDFGEDTHLYLMMYAPGTDLEAVTLSLATTRQVEWVHKGPGIIDEVVVYNAAAAEVSPLPREDESLFRDQMARRATPEAAEKDLAEDAETYEHERMTDDAQHGGENATGS